MSEVPTHLDSRMLGVILNGPNGIQQDVMIARVGPDPFVLRLCPLSELQLARHEDLAGSVSKKRRKVDTALRHASIELTKPLEFIGRS
jgi:hypothetical protein